MCVRLIALTAVLSLPAAALAQLELPNSSTNVSPAPKGPDPRTPDGVPRVGIPNYIGQFPNYLIFIYPGQPAGGAFRMIPTDGRKHTPLDEVDPTVMGEGIGHWEGDTLVVDTWGFSNDTWIDQPENGGGGFFHSDNMHVIERFHRDGNTLTWTAKVEDPDVLLEPWTTTPRVSTLNPNPKAVISSGYPCSDIAISHSVSKQRH